MDDDLIRALQRGLKAAGFDPGAVDGVEGPKTMAAMAAYRRAHGGAAPIAETAAALEPYRAPGSLPAQMFQGAKRYPIREIIVHCTATPPGWFAGATLAEKRAEVRRWHMQDRGWRDIGYHWLIDRDGSRIAGRAETEIGAHVEGHNAGTIGISLIGGFGSAATDKFSQHFTAAQDAALRQLMREIFARTRIEKIRGHNDYAAKACPGFNVTKWLTGL